MGSGRKLRDSGVVGEGQRRFFPDPIYIGRRGLDFLIRKLRSCDVEDG